MAHYVGAKARVNRRLGALIYESRGAMRAFARRESPPGMNVRPRRPSNYGLALIEKQKIKHYYGLSEKQLRRYFQRATRTKGNTGEILLIMCERRLDNVMRRAGFTFTRPQARQAVAHGHFQVNGHKVSAASYQTRPGDVITVRPRENLKNYYRGIIEQNTTEPTDWITTDTSSLEIRVQGAPGRDDISLPVDVNIVVEFLSR